MVQEVLSSLLTQRENVEEPRRARVRALTKREVMAQARALLRTGRPVNMSALLHDHLTRLEHFNVSFPSGAGRPLPGGASLAAAAAAAAQYFMHYVSGGDGDASRRQPPDRYLALSLLYGAPHLEDPRLTAFASLLPPVRELRSYGFEPQKYTQARRYVTRCAERVISSTSCTSSGDTVAFTSMPSDVTV